MSYEEVETPRQQVLESALAAVLGNLRPVRRLPSDAVLAGLALLLFTVVSMAISLALGWKGYASLANSQRWLYYGTVLACGVLLSIDVAPQMIPGARRSLSLAATLIFPIAAVFLCSIVIFPSSDLARFVPLGIPCLRTALLCAAASGVLAYFLFRQGYVTTPVQTSISTAVLASFTGIAVLALHCPQQNWLHVFVWHLGAPLLSALATWVYWKFRISNPHRNF